MDSKNNSHALPATITLRGDKYSSHHVPAADRAWVADMLAQINAALDADMAGIEGAFEHANGLQATVQAEMIEWVNRY